MQATSLKMILPLAIALLLTLSPCSFSAEANHPSPIKLATAENFAPYAQINEINQWEGIDYDIALAIFSASGVQFKPVALPRARITNMLGRKKVDGLLSTAAYNEQKSLNDLWLSIPIYSSEASVFSLKSNPIEADDSSILQTGAFRVGLLKEYSYQDEEVGFNKPSSVIEVYRDRQLVELLLAKRIDLAVSEDISFIYQVRRLGMFNSIKPVVEISSRPVRVALTQDIIQQHPSLPEQINKTISQLLENGFIDSVIVKHLSLDRFAHAE